LKPTSFESTCYFFYFIFSLIRFSDSVKELVHQMEKIPVDKQRIFLTGHVLDDTVSKGKKK